MVQAKRVIKLPEQLPIVPVQFDCAVFVDEIESGTCDIDVTRRIDFHVDGEIVAAAHRNLPERLSLVPRERLECLL